MKPSEKHATATFQESTYGDYVLFPQGTPRGRPTDKSGLFVHAGEMLVVANSTYNDGEYLVCSVETDRIIVAPDPGFVSENAKDAVFSVKRQMESKKPFEVGDDFRGFITSLTIPELLSLAKDLGQFPEDKNYRSAINDEVKTRARAVSTRVSGNCTTIDQVKDWIAWCCTLPDFRPGTVAYGALLKLKQIVEEGVSRNEPEEEEGE